MCETVHRSRLLRLPALFHSNTKEETDNVVYLHRKQQQRDKTRSDSPSHCHFRISHVQNDNIRIKGGKKIILHLKVI